MEKEIELKTFVKIPDTPNFLIVEGNPVSISNFDKSQLEEVGRVWTQNLINKMLERK
jgi:hypothetical protein